MNSSLDYIEIIEPSKPIVTSCPTVRWIYKGDLSPDSVDIEFIDLKTFKRIHYFKVDARAKEFTPSDPLPAGYYDVRVRTSEPIFFHSKFHRLSVAPADHLAGAEKKQQINRPARKGPVAISPEGQVTHEQLNFKWTCDDKDIISFSIQVFESESKKLIEAFNGIPPFQSDFTPQEEDLGDLLPAKYYWRIKAFYFERDLFSETKNIEIMEKDQNRKSVEPDGTSIMAEGEIKKEHSNLSETTKPGVIRLNNVSVKFKKTRTGPRKAIARSLTSLFSKLSKSEDFWALKEINFNLQEGDVLGVVGNNGAGKSTLLKILVGVLYPDSGTVKINGKISSLLTLGAGFDPNLNGKDNILLNGTYLGLSKMELNRKIDQIIEFAELENFIDTQVRYFSSGMKARLGFSVAVHVDPEILIIDEVLAAGDINFRKKAEEKMREFMQKAKAIVIASHSTKLISDLCNKCLWLENGQIKYFGDADETVKKYMDS